MPVAETDFEFGPYGSVQDDQDYQVGQDGTTIESGAPGDDSNQESAPPPPKPSKPLVGIIYPPPEFRNIVDKTATFVARNGPEFETRIRLNEQNNPKFNFLNSGDPYHAYYLHKVKEIQEGKPVPEKPAGTAPVSVTEPVPKPGVPSIDELKKKKQSELLKQVEQPFVPKDPPAEFEFVADPPSISAQDLDIVKLTAQFVARNGRQFLSTLMTREQRNTQFDFLRPQHSLFQYFTKLLEQYTKVLIPPKDIVKRLDKEDVNKILADVKYRANWIKHIEAQKQREEEAAEKERLAYASIDWHDFVVVETVDYQPFEAGNFPAPTTPQEVGARVLLQDRILQGQPSSAQPEETYTAQDDTEVQDMEEDTSSEEEDETEPAKSTQPIITTEERGEVIIKKGYDPKLAKAAGPAKSAAAAEEYTISPITGERIPVSKLHEHVRIGLLDPRWREQNWRSVIEKANQESPYAMGAAIDESLKQLAERRSDIFGTGIEEVSTGKKAGEEGEGRVPGMPWIPEQMNREDDADESGDIESMTQEPPKPPQPAPPPVSAPPPAPYPGTLPPQMGQIPGIIRMPPGPGQPGAPPPGVMMQSMPGVRPLLGMPPQQGYPPFGAPPGAMGNRPPLLAPMPPVGLPPPHMPSMIPPPVAAPPVEEEPASKKAKTLEDGLIPEDEFMATNGSPVTFTVAMPSVPDKPEMNLNGQLLTFTMDLTENVSTLKSRISDAIGLAPGKQKFWLTEGLFFKDQNTLAFYNVGDGANVHLSLKERGGRKK